MLSTKVSSLKKEARMLKYRTQVRDLVHGYIGFTNLERNVIDHPLFQRLRNVRQADVAYFVYPSSNISRFEHLLGACHVAGGMAENLTGSPQWNAYVRNLKNETDVRTKEQFVQVARLYALLHDIGHLPLSHLFERSLEAYADANKIPMEILVQEWFGESGFTKPHEAFGAKLVDRIAQDVSMEDPIRSTLLRLMKEKDFPSASPLNPLKLLVDSNVDADRIDFIRRDGLLAGGEYGNYDIRRLTTSTYLYQDKDRKERVWEVVYSERALNSLEALLFDRYRTYAYINFHHRVVTTKLLTRFLIRVLIERGIVTKASFEGDNRTLSLRNDLWLWSLIYALDTRGDRVLSWVKEALLQRRKNITLTLWKNRPRYENLVMNAMRSAGLTALRYKEDLLEEAYGRYLSERLGIKTLVFYTDFSPLGRTAIKLYNEQEQKLFTQSLFDVSELVSNLNAIWLREPQFYVALLGDVGKKALKVWQHDWHEVTVDWLRNKR